MPVPSLITDLTTVAGTNSPLGSESPATADDYFRAHASFIAQLRASVAEIGAPYCTASGTVNAIALTPNNSTSTPTSYVSGALYRARVGATNTGATTLNVSGLGAKSCVTITGAALPAGYIRTDIDTVFTYDATGNRFVVSREEETGTNANGTYTKYACGKLVCIQMAGASLGCATALGALFSSASPGSWTFPAAFVVEAPLVAVSPVGTTFRWGVVSSSTLISAQFYHLNGASDASARVTALRAEGRWYA